MQRALGAVSGVYPSSLLEPVLRLRRALGRFVKTGMEEICAPVNVFDSLCQCLGQHKNADHEA
jgi:hypothetical protein